MAVERKSSLRKAPVVDVVDSLTAGATETSNPKAGVPSALEVRAAERSRSLLRHEGQDLGVPGVKDGWSHFHPKSKSNYAMNLMPTLKPPESRSPIFLTKQFAHV